MQIPAPQSDHFPQPSSPVRSPSYAAETCELHKGIEVPLPLDVKLEPQVHVEALVEPLQIEN